jgi:hypothetical protein
MAVAGRPGYSCLGAVARPITSRSDRVKEEDAEHQRINGRCHALPNATWVVVNSPGERVGTRTQDSYLEVSS